MRRNTFLILLVALVLWSIAAAKIMTKVVVHWDDGSTDTVLAPLPATSQPSPSTQASSDTGVAPVTRPTTVPNERWRPAWLVLPSPPRLSGNVVAATPATLKSALANLKNGDTLQLQRGHRYDLIALLGDAMRIGRSDVKITAYGDGARPTLYYTGPYQVVSITGSRVLFDGIDVETAYVRLKTSGFYINGKDVHIRNVAFPVAGEQCVNVRPNAGRVLIERCANTGPTAGYFVYSNADDVSLIDCVVTLTEQAGFRCNEVKRQYLEGCTWNGKAGGNGLHARVTMAIVDQAAIVRCRFHNTEIGVAPNMNVNALAQAGDNADAPAAERHRIMISKRSSSVDVRDNTFTGSVSGIEIGHGCDGVWLVGNQPKTVRMEILRPDVFPAEGGQWSRPGAKNVTIDGQKVSL